MLQTEIETRPFVVFQLASEWFVLPTAQVRSIERWRLATSVPGTPPIIVGIVNQRGTLVTVLDVRGLLGLQTDIPGRTTRLLFTRVAEIDVALIADQVADLLDLDVQRTEPAPHRVSGYSDGLIHTPFGLATILNLDAILASVQGVA